MLLELDDEDAESFEDERNRIERRSEREIADALSNQRNELFPDDFDPNRDAPSIQQRLAAERGVQEALRRALRDSADLGVRFGIAHLDTASFGFDWTLSHAQAREYADEFAGLLIQDINTTTLQRVQNAITAWIDAGTPLASLVDDLAPIFGRERAKLISSTEVTRSYARGSVIAYQNSGVVEGLQWFTVNDERTCPICAPLGGLVFGNDGAEPVSVAQQERNGVRTRLGDLFVHPGGGGAAGGFAGQAFSLPPAHPRCRCRVQPILDEVTVSTQPSRVLTAPPAIGEPLRGNAGTSEVEDWISERYPSTVFDLSGGIDADVARRAMVQYDKLAQRWPEAARRVRYFGTYADDGKRPSPISLLPSFAEDTRFGNSHAWIQDVNVFGINPAWFGRPVSFNNSLRSSLLDNWTDADGSIESVVAHEFGHLVENYLKSLNAERLIRMPDGSDVVHEFPEEGTIAALLRSFHKKYEATAQLSRYATVNTSEAAAESFANIAIKDGVDGNGDEIEFSTRYRHFLNEFLAWESSSVRADGAPVRQWDDLSDSDKDIWMQERKKLRERFGVD